jgi:hypothetical protein
MTHQCPTLSGNFDKPFLYLKKLGHELHELLPSISSRSSEQNIWTELF